MDLSHVSFSGVEPPIRAPARSTVPLHRNRPNPSDKASINLDPLAEWVLSSGGVNPRLYRPEPLQRRMPTCLRRLRATSSSALLELLQQSPHSLAVALDTLLIGVSAFFRDVAVFDALERHVIPQLLAERRGIRVLSAGTSTGEELYSIAILLDGMGALPHSELLGVDCRARAVERARQGIFSEEAMQSLSRSQRDRYFSPTGTGWIAADLLRQRMSWKCCDLFDLKTDSPWDLVLFRNVAIYLEPSAAARAWEQLCAQTSPGGFLVAGKAEHPPKSAQLTRMAPSIFRRT